MAHGSVRVAQREKVGSPSVHYGGPTAVFAGASGLAAEASNWCVLASFSALNGRVFVMKSG